MKTIKISFDFSDHAKLVEILGVHAAKKGVTQKSILIDALQLYFASQQEDEFMLSAANKIFAEWNNPDDEVYDTL